MLVLVIISIFTIVLTIFLLNLLRVTTNFDEVPIVKTVEGTTPLVSIIVPMRNEERNAMQCIESLLSQSYPNVEVIAVDDLSKDKTLSILNQLALAHTNLKVIEGTSTPEDWTGKTHALWQGVMQANGDWLLFLDADITSKPYMLTSVIRYVQENTIDMLSVSPFHVLETFWERIIQPIIFTSIFYAFTPKKINDPKSKIAAALGGFILIRRGVYEALGGHSPIRNSIVEDFSLAYLVKSSGYKLRIMKGEKLVSVKWYTNFAEIWEGWTKNIFVGLGKKWGQLVFSVFMLFVLGVFFPVLFAWSCLEVFFFGVKSYVWLVILAESLFLLILTIYIGLHCTHLFAIPRYYSFTFPIGIAIFIAIMLASAYKVTSGSGVTWKERVYRL
ncbi:MAG: glycosyltransferase [Candidatus Dadabacteria bacterium]|nr:glycosyltransferase [Candidatus Dadabacteria bacterium]